MTQQLTSSPETIKTPPEIVKAQFLDLSDPTAKFRITASALTSPRQYIVSQDFNDSSTLNLAKYVQGINLLPGEHYFNQPGEGEALVLFQEPNGFVRSIIRSDGGKHPHLTELELGRGDTGAFSVLSRHRVDNYKPFTLDAGMRVVVYTKQTLTHWDLPGRGQGTELSEHAEEFRTLYAQTQDFLQGKALEPARSTLRSSLIGWLSLGTME